MAKISVCIPTYNYGRYIGAAIESVLAQTEQDFEIIVSDNASDDDSEKIVGAYAAGDSRIRYVRNSRNIGMVGNWNRCLSLSTGNYIKFLCADDLLESRCLERLSQLMEQRETVVLAACARELFNENGESRFAVRAYSKKQELLDGLTVIRRCVARGNLIGEPSAVMFRRSSARQGFDASYPQVVDLEMWLRLLEQGMFAFTPEALCRFRQHSDQETRRNLLSKDAFADEFRLYRLYSNRQDITIGPWDKMMGYLRRQGAYRLSLLKSR